MIQETDLKMIPVRTIYMSLLLFIAVLLMMNFFPIEWSSDVSNFFDLDQEANIPTWFSSILLFSVAIAALLIYILGHSTESSHSWRYFWPGFCAVFCFLSMDEALGFHEMITATHNINWIYIYAPLGILFFIISSYYLEYINKNKDLTNHIVAGLTIYALGILTSETFNSYLSLGKIKTTIEEGFEMFGAVFVLTGCLKEVNRLLKFKGDFGK